MTNTTVHFRVSNTSQDTRIQGHDLRKWASSQRTEASWYRDRFTSTTLEQPGLERLLSDVRARKVKKFVVWRLDRLGRTAKVLHELFEELLLLKDGFLSLRGSLDLATSAGRLMVGVLASVAQYETEVRRERRLADIAKVRDLNGGRCPWGGRKKRTRVRVTEEKVAAILAMHREKGRVSTIARTVGVTRKTVYAVLKKCDRPAAKPE